MFDFINKLKAERAERKAEAELRASLELECERIKEEKIKEEQKRQYKEFVEKQKKRPIEDLLVDIYIQCLTQKHLIDQMSEKIDSLSEELANLTSTVDNIDCNVEQLKLDNDDSIV